MRPHLPVSVHEVLSLDCEATRVGSQGSLLHSVGEWKESAHEVGERRTPHELLEEREKPELVGGVCDLQLLVRRVVSDQRR